MSATARISLALVALLALPERAAARPDTPGTTELFRYEASDVVEAHDSPGGAFRVHFTRAGTNAVPLRDDDASGVPDHVERVAVIYDEVLAFYRDELGFRAPLGDGSLADAGGGHVLAPIAPWKSFFTSSVRPSLVLNSAASIASAPPCLRPAPFLSFAFFEAGR